MKKLIAVVLTFVLMLTMAACAAQTEDTTQAGEQVPLSTTQPEEELSVEEIMEASASDAQSKSEPPASSTDAVVDEQAYAAAQECIGRTVEELYAAIGEPTDSQYAASCAEEDAEDGMLFYDGFYVWSLRTADEEIVHDVYLLD